MRRRREELFEDVEVVYVPSSSRSESPNVRRTIDADMEGKVKVDVLQRMPKGYAEVYRTYLPQEQQQDMQEKFTAATKKFRPYVHAELVLLDSILTEKKSRFFAESQYGRYIGCSKPTCRLCKLYIENHPSGVEVRPGHGNIYHQWRAPDIIDKVGINVDEASKAREKIHGAMLEKLRHIIKRTITENMAERWHHDSNSTPTSTIGAGSSTCGSHLGAQAALDMMENMSTTGAMDDSDGVTTTLGRLSISGDSGRPSSSTSPSMSSQGTTPVPDRNGNSPAGSSVNAKPFLNRRQRPVIIEDD